MVDDSVPFFDYSELVVEKEKKEMAKVSLASGTEKKVKLGVN